MALRPGGSWCRTPPSLCCRRWVLARSSAAARVARSCSRAYITALCHITPSKRRVAFAVYARGSVTPRRFELHWPIPSKKDEFEFFFPSLPFPSFLPSVSRKGKWQSEPSTISRLVCLDDRLNFTATLYYNGEVLDIFPHLQKPKKGAIGRLKFIAKVVSVGLCEFASGGRPRIPP